MISKIQLLKVQDIYKTDLAMSKALNLSVQRVNQLRKKYDIPAIKVKVVNDKRNDLIRTIFKNSKVSKKSLSEQFKLSIKTIDRILKGEVDDNKQC
jgi:predicted HTH transcriptional regulator